MTALAKKDWHNHHFSGTITCQPRNRLFQAGLH
jgi:hypothetical protein